MQFCSGSDFGRQSRRKTTILLLMSVVFFMLAAGSIYGQRRFSRTYPAAQSVRLELVNRSGTVTVEGWDRPEISITASLEAPAALVQPQSLSGKIVVNLIKDNSGRGDVGNVNFIVRVPYYTEVDIETLIGNLNVSNIRSTLVRAHVSAEGDITLTNITSKGVSAENVTGDIFFDGALTSGGYYRFTSMKGNINIRIPFSSSFTLVATAPSTKSINLGAFSGGVMKPLGDGRRIVGRFGDGAASMQITNQRGAIQFIQR
jgi:DUF4097 and DUF4098 domain-containing protein YvlB